MAKTKMSYILFKTSAYYSETMLFTEKRLPISDFGQFRRKKYLLVQMFQHSTVINFYTCHFSYLNLIFLILI